MSLLKFATIEVKPLIQKGVMMKSNRRQKERQLLKQQRPPQLIYNPAQQFKHRDRGTQSGRTNIR